MVYLTVAGWRAGTASVLVAPPLPPDGVAEAEAENAARLPVEAVLGLAAVIDDSVRAAAYFVRRDRRDRTAGRVRKYALLGTAF